MGILTYPAEVKTLPPIDTAIPPVIETATFALG